MRRSSSVWTTALAILIHTHTTQSWLNSWQPCDTGRAQCGWSHIQSARVCPLLWEHWLMVYWYTIPRQECRCRWSMRNTSVYCSIPLITSWITTSSTCYIARPTMEYSSISEWMTRYMRTSMAGASWKIVSKMELTPPPSRETRRGRWQDNIHNCQLKYMLRNNMDELIQEALRRRNKK